MSETWRPKQNPWEPADYDDDVILAVRALEKGVANAGQQQLTCEWLKYVCGADDWAFRPGSDTRATDIMLGRQFVWQQFEKMKHPALDPKVKEKPQVEQRSISPAKRPEKLTRPRKTNEQS